MLTDLCQELKNWFDRDMPKVFGKFVVRDNEIFFINYTGTEKPLTDFGLVDNQYFRVIGSKFNDGVHQYPASDLADETFDGAVWFMAIPQAVIVLDRRIEDWNTKYGEVASSPYISESFGGYSRTLASSNGGSKATSWQGVFKSDLNKWRKL